MRGTLSVRSSESCEQGPQVARGTVREDAGGSLKARVHACRVGNEKALGKRICNVWSCNRGNSVFSRVLRFLGVHLGLCFYIPMRENRAGELRCFGSI